MYDMYPDWGLASPDPESPVYPVSPPRQSQPVQESLDSRDNGGRRCDDD